jgi:glycine/D-amino acid oxidase-like deaminating enzyme
VSERNAGAIPFNSHPQSYWAATGGLTQALPVLTSDAEVDAVIVGAGFTGLSAAYRLAGAGAKCLVLEANDVGWGASGRNGGMVVPRFKHTFPELAKRYGAPIAIDMYHAAHRAVDLIEAIVHDEGMDCGFSRCGHLTPFVQEQTGRRFEADAMWLASEVADNAPRILDRAEIERRSGSTFYRGAYFEPRGGAIHPLRFCRQLATAVTQRGGRIHVHTPVLSFSSDGAFTTVRTPRATVKARKLLLATNAYTDLTGAGDEVKRRIVPVTSSLIATEPLNPAIRATVLPLGNVVTDAKRLTNYFRISDDGRMIFGGRGGASNKESSRIYRRLAREMEQIYPSLCGQRVEYKWSGRVAVTLDGLPHVGKIAESTFFAMGYNGRGIALSILLGQMLADLSRGEAVATRPLIDPLQPISFHAFRLPGKKIVMTYYKALDALGL